MNIFRKSLHTHNLPANLEFLTTEKLRYSIYASRERWQKYLNKLETSSLSIYSPLVPNDKNVLILPTLLDYIDLKTLITSLKALNISPWILIPQGLCVSPEEFCEVQKLLPLNYVVFSIGISLAATRESQMKSLAFNPIFHPDQHFQSLPTHEDQELLSLANANSRYLKSAELPLSISLAESVVKAVPRIKPVEIQKNVFYYFTNACSLDIPHASEAKSMMHAKRERILSRIISKLFI